MVILSPHLTWFGLSQQGSELDSEIAQTRTLLHSFALLEYNRHYFPSPSVIYFSSVCLLHASELLFKSFSLQRVKKKKKKKHKLHSNPQPTSQSNTLWTPVRIRTPSGELKGHKFIQILSIFCVSEMLTFCDLIKNTPLWIAEWL